MPLGLANVPTEMSPTELTVPPAVKMAPAPATVMLFADVVVLEASEPPAFTLRLPPAVVAAVITVPLMLMSFAPWVWTKAALVMNPPVLTFTGPLVDFTVRLPAPLSTMLPLTVTPPAVIVLACPAVETIVTAPVTFKLPVLLRVNAPTALNAPRLVMLLVALVKFAALPAPVV